MAQVIDENGHKYRSLYAAARAFGVVVGGHNRRRLEKNGKVSLNGHTIYLDGEIPTEKGEVREGHRDPLMEQLRQRYSYNELKALAHGEGIDRRRIDYPKIHLTGRHHHFVVISDTHIGSTYSPDEWHDVVSKYVNSHEDIEGVFHCGDLVEGMKIKRMGTQVYELSEIGYEAQKAKAEELLRKYKRPVYIISGNHDAYYMEYANVNIVKNVAHDLDHVTYLGHDEADIDIDGAIIRLFHGGDGNSYALSYRLQKICEMITGGKKPNILLAGHVHKFCYIFERHIHAISVPCMQMQTNFMRGKKIAAHTGFLDLQFDVEGGSIRNLSVTLFPFYA